MKNKDIALKVSKILKEKWKDPQYKDKHIHTWCKSPNKLEKQFILLFQQNNIPFKFTGNGKYWINSRSGRYRCPDFINTELKKVILICGEHWHPPQKIREQINDYKSVGLSTLILLDKDVVRSKGRSPTFPYNLKENYILSLVNSFLKQEGATA